MTDPVHTITVVSGTGEHADPWHALDANAAALADILSSLGAVRTTTTAEPLPAHLGHLLVLVVGGNLATPPPRSTVLVDAIEQHHRAGRPILAMHSAALAFRDDPRWHTILGGCWLPGVSMHPQIGHALVQATPPAAVPKGLAAFAEDFVLYDERYSFLQLDDAIVLAQHTEDGRAHPLVWGRPADAARGAVVYDGLGHGVESYACPAHADWLRDTARTLLTGAPRKMV